MQIVLPSEIKTFVEREVASGRYRDTEQVVIEALRRMARDNPYPPISVAEAVADSLAQVERGEVVEWSDDFLERSAERASANSRIGHKVPDDVKH